MDKRRSNPDTNIGQGCALSMVALSFILGVLFYGLFFAGLFWLAKCAIDSFSG